MNPALEFKEKTKKKIVLAVIAMALIIFSLFLRHFGVALGFSLSQARWYSLVPLVVSLVLFLRMVHLNTCPSCKKQSGVGLSIKECKNCGISLHSNS